MVIANKANRTPKVVTKNLSSNNKFQSGGGSKEALLILNEQLKVVLDKTPMGVYLIDEDLCILAANPTALTIFGLFSDMIGRDSSDVVKQIWSHEYAKKILQIFRHTLQTGEQYYTSELTLKRCDNGITEYYEWLVNRIQLTDGKDGLVWCFRDVSEQVNARLALAQSEEKYRTLFNSVEQGFTLCELIRNKQGKAIDFYMLEVNSTYEKQTGVSKEMVLGKRIIQTFPSSNNRLETYAAVVDNQRPVVFEYYFEYTKRWFAIKAYPVEKDKFAIIFSNITDRKRREANLSFLIEVSGDLVGSINIDETLQMLCKKISVHFSLSAVGFSEVDEATGIGITLQVWNDGDIIILRDSYRIADYHSEEVQQQMRSGIPEIVRDISTFPKDIADNLRAIKIGAYVNMPLVRNGKWSLTLSIIDSKPRDWYKDELALINELTSRIWSWLERVRAEEELFESQNKLLLALEAAEMGTFVWYPQEDKTDLDTGTLSLFGLREGDEFNHALALGKIVHPYDREAFAAAITKALDPNGDGKLNVDYRVIHPDGSLHWLNSQGQTTYKSKISEQETTLQGIVIDITLRKQAQKEQKLQYEMEKHVELLTAQRNALLKINKTKDEFIAMASHQLRTPATVVKQYISLLLDNYAGHVTAVQKAHLQTAYQSNERQLTVINDLLKTAQLDSVTYKLTIKTFNIVAMVKDAIAELQSVFKLQNQTVVFKSSNKTIQAVADRTEMKLVFVNLLENASKYSYPGTEINVSIKKTTKMVLITITDLGVGINKENKQRIFDKFTRIDNDLSDTVSGSGLGLYWVKRIVEMHGGTINLSSELKKGSSFTVTLPL